MNKKKRVALIKHRLKRKKLELKRKAERTQAAKKHALKS